jgi:ArsR family transcriptional regulator, arsenate/arsenite/antimonite-responsive transcriptional repressor
LKRIPVDGERAIWSAPNAREGQTARVRLILSTPPPVPEISIFARPTRLAFAIYIRYSGFMDDIETIAAFAALAQTTRLDTFRLLVAREPEGVPAGELARLMAVPQNTMSAHLSILSRAGLVSGERHSRSIIYRANLARLRELVSFLLKDCCGGRPDVCAPLIAEISPCRANAKEQDHDR